MGTTPLDPLRRRGGTREEGREGRRKVRSQEQEVRVSVHYSLVHISREGLRGRDEEKERGRRGRETS